MPLLSGLGMTFGFLNEIKLLKVSNMGSLLLNGHCKTQVIKALKKD
jgi:hypothetical protein